jgi:hypothetical protein
MTTISSTYDLSKTGMIKRSAIKPTVIIEDTFKYSTDQQYVVKLVLEPCVTEDTGLLITMTIKGKASANIHLDEEQTQALFQQLSLIKPNK